MTTFMITLGHHRIEMLENFFHNAMEKTTGDFVWAFLWQHYPLPDKAENTERAYALAHRYGLKMFDAGRGLGCSGGVRYVMDKLGIGSGDFVSCCDPDEYFETKGWNEILQRVASDPRFPIATCWNDRTYSEISLVEHYQPRLDFAAGEAVVVAPVPCIMQTAMIRAEWWLTMGGYGDAGRLYGGVEGHFWNQLNASGRQMAFVPSVRVSHGPAGFQVLDREYISWKWAHAHQGFEGDFEAFLAAR